MIGANIRSAEVRQKEIEQIAAYKDLVDLVNTKVREDYMIGSGSIANLPLGL